MNTSLSGLIQVPKDLLNKVRDQAHLLLLSWAYHETRLNPSYKNHHELILKLCKYYKITPLDKFKLSTSFKVTYTDEDLPKSYFKYYNNSIKQVSVKLDHEARSTLYGYFQQPDMISFSTKSFLITLSNSTMDEDGILRYFNIVDNAIEHELTHFIQYNYLHKSNIAQRADYSDSLEGYYGSNIEFDPSIKSAMYYFAEMLVSDKSILEKYTVNDAVKFFTLSDNGLEVSFDNGKIHLKDTKLTRSDLFLTLKNLDIEKYKIALKTFVTHYNYYYREYKKHHADVIGTKAVRLDAVFCNLRLNEFHDFVNLCNTFIAFPETRLEDYKSLSKYIQNIDDAFKSNRIDPVSTFVRCDGAAIKSIVAEGKSFKINTIFVDSNATTGMLFDITGYVMILDIEKIYTDSHFLELCKEYEFKLASCKDRFAIVDGSNVKLNKLNLLGVYKNGTEISI